MTITVQVCQYPFGEGLTSFETPEVPRVGEFIRTEADGLRTKEVEVREVAWVLCGHRNVGMHPTVYVVPRRGTEGERR